MSLTAWAKRTADFVKFMLAAEFCVDTVQVKSGQTLTRGQIIGLTLQSGATATGAAAAWNTGNGTIGTISAGTAAQVGVYKIVFISAATNLGNFLVFDPYGVCIGRGIVGTAFSGEIVFTVADGATDFAEGDAFTVTVAGSYEAAALNLSATNRTNIAAGVVLEDVDASAAAVKGPILRRGSAVVADAGLGYPSGITAAQKVVAHDQLGALGIKVAEAA